MAQPDDSMSGDYAAKTFYRGDVARHYDQVRQKTRSGARKWGREEEALRRVLRRLPAHSTILDSPCGTGRFAQVFGDVGLRSVGLDISSDMLAMHRRAAPEEPDRIRLLQADLERLPLGDSSVDYVVAMRFFNLVPLGVAQRVLREFSRVARSGVIIEIRLAGEKPWDGARRRLRRMAAAARRWAHRGGVNPGSPPGPGPLRIHRAGEFRDAARSAGLRVESLTEVLPSTLHQPDALHLVVLRRDH